VIRQTFDMVAVNMVLTHPDIWKDIAPEHPAPFDTPYLLGVTYFLVNDGDGVIMFHEFRDGLKIHPNILPSKRGRLAYIAVEDAIQCMFDEGCPCIYAEIDQQLRHVVMFARQLGYRLLDSGIKDLFIRRRLHS